MRKDDRGSRRIRTAFSFTHLDHLDQGPRPKRNIHLAASTRTLVSTFKKFGAFLSLHTPAPK